MTNEKITKSDAILLLRRARHPVYPTVTFASKNKGAETYWANPNINLLRKDWSIILNDTERRKLHLFNISAGAIPKSLLCVRSDNPELLDIKIQYNNSCFRDIRSDFQFYI